MVWAPNKGCRTLVQIRPEPTRQNRTEMSEGNRIHAFLPDCAHLFRSDRNRRVRSHPNRSRILWKIFLLIVLMVRRGCACAEGRCVAVAGEAHEFGDQANGTLASIHFGSGLKRLLWCAQSVRSDLIWGVGRFGGGSGLNKCAATLRNPDRNNSLWPPYSASYSELWHLWVPPRNVFDGLCVSSSFMP